MKLGPLLLWGGAAVLVAWLASCTIHVQHRLSITRPPTPTPTVTPAR